MFPERNESLSFLKNGRVVKFNRFFLKLQKIVDYRQKFYLSKYGWGMPLIHFSCGVAVITTAQLHSSKPELRLCAGSNPVHGVSEIRDGEDLLQWSQLEIRLRLSSVNHTTKIIHHHPSHSHAPQFSTSFSSSPIFHLILKLPNIPPNSHALQYSTSFSSSPIFHLILMLPNVPPHSHAPQNIPPHSHAPQNLPPHSHVPQCSTSFSCSPMFHLILTLCVTVL